MLRITAHHLLLILKVLIGLIVLYGTSAQAANQCRGYLSDAPLPRLSQTQPVFERTWNRYQDTAKDRKLLRDHIQATTDHLKAHGIEHSMSNNKIVILPTQATEINRFAERVFNRHQVLTFYDPRQLAQRGCEACVEYSALSLTPNYLGISHEALRTGRLTPAEYHEWRHLVEIAKYTQDRTTPLLSGELRTVTRQAGKRKFIQNFSFEEFFTYYTESSATMALYRQGKVGKRATLLRLEDNFEFLHAYAAEILDPLGIAQSTIYRSFKHNGAPKMFQNLNFDADHLIAFKGNIGFDFTPIANDKYRVRLRLSTNNFSFTMMLKEPMAFATTGRNGIPLLTLAEFETLTQKAYSQILDANMAILNLYDLTSQPRKTIEDYQNLLNDYRLTIQPYQ
ncbi:MAG: hypothetical protein M9899_08540 [Bdellovibrionaceae bacterium]|nr:hypothetical protein [Pseudobdellovibrionaceae bacterium]